MIMSDDLVMVAVFPAAEQAAEYYAALTSKAEANWALDIALDGNTVTWAYDRAARDRMAAERGWDDRDVADYAANMREHVGYWGTSPNAYYGTSEDGEAPGGGVATLNGRPCPPSF